MYVAHEDLDRAAEIVPKYVAVKEEFSAEWDAAFARAYSHKGLFRGFLISRARRNFNPESGSRMSALRREYESLMKTGGVGDSYVVMEEQMSGLLEGGYQRNEARDDYDVRRFVREWVDLKQRVANGGSLVS